MAMETFLVRTMSDTVETDIQRVLIIANEILPRYNLAPLSFEQLRKIADGPFDLFLIPYIFAQEYGQNRNLAFNEAKRVEIRRQALEIARKHGFDVNPPDFIPGIDESLKETKAAGLRNVLMTTGGRRYKHQAMEKVGIGDYFEEIVDRDETYYAKEQGLYHLYRKHALKHMRIVLLSGTATYIQAGNNAHGCKVGETFLEVVPIALSTEHSYNDEQTLAAAQPKALIHSYSELLPTLKELTPLG
ncbi:MAG TPA: HAD hydrolase-like protein [Candidatus Binatia bacterium]|nr:HAD hydrolase-like protein [Candidatus Binatia bacterium]